VQRCHGAMPPAFIPGPPYCQIRLNPFSRMGFQKYFERIGAFDAGKAINALAGAHTNPFSEKQGSDYSPIFIQTWCPGLKPVAVPGIFNFVAVQCP
jgi:hypothetical protein